MNNRDPQKLWKREEERHPSHSHRRDPRTVDTLDEDESVIEDEGTYFAFRRGLDNEQLTDLDVAYSILFEDANNEYIRERAQKEETKQKGKAAIPQRVFASFLSSIENDVMEYVQLSVRSDV